MQGTGPVKCRARLRWWRWGFAGELRCGHLMLRAKLSLTAPRRVSLRIRVGGRLAGVERHEHDACNGAAAWHIHIGSCHSIVWCGPRPRLYTEARRRK